MEINMLTQIKFWDVGLAVGELIMGDKIAGGEQNASLSIPCSRERRGTTGLHYGVAVLRGGD